MSVKRAAPTGSPQPSQAGEPRRAIIFLVEEDEAVCDALARSLRAAGHLVNAFSSGRQFFDHYQPGDPGCVVVDGDLGDLDVMELLDWIPLPAVVTSRRLKRRLPPRRLADRQILFLDKPFGIEELLEHIHMALEMCSGGQAGS